jgi:hypothetical protein
MANGLWAPAHKRLSTSSTFEEETPMRIRPRSLIVLAASLGLLGALTLSGIAIAAETTLTATLAGVTEGANPGDPDGSGTATIRIDPAAGTACWDLSATGIMPVVQSHIHTGAAGVAGPVLVNLDIDGFEGTSTGCTPGVDAAVLQGIIDNPAGFYVNLHTSDFQAGAIRGQLAAASVPSTALPATDLAPITILGAALLGAAALTGVRALRAREARR